MTKNNFLRHVLSIKDPNYNEIMTRRVQEKMFQQMAELATKLEARCALECSIKLAPHPSHTEIFFIPFGLV